MGEAVVAVADDINTLGSTFGFGELKEQQFSLMHLS